MYEACSFFVKYGKTAVYAGRSPQGGSAGDGVAGSDDSDKRGNHVELVLAGTAKRLQPGGAYLDGQRSRYVFFEKNGAVFAKKENSSCAAAFR